MSPRGGARKGAGAPKKEAEQKRVQVTLQLTTNHLAYLDNFSTERSISRSRALELILDLLNVTTARPSRKVCAGQIEESEWDEDINMVLTAAEELSTSMLTTASNEDDSSLDELLALYHETEEGSRKEGNIPFESGKYPGFED